MSRYSYIIVEDEPLQLEHLSKLLQNRLDLQSLGEFSSANEAFEFIAKLDRQSFPDLLFLDLQMPRKGDGFGLLMSIRHLNMHHRTIIFSAHADAALEGYLYPSVSGFIAKPVELNKLHLAIDKAIAELRLPETKSEQTIATQQTPPMPSALESLKVVVDGKIIRIPHQDIVCLEGSGNNVKIVTVGEEIFEPRGPLKNFYKELQDSHFLRVHDSFIINLNEVVGAARNCHEVYLKARNGSPIKTINVGRVYRNEFKNNMADLGLL